MPAAPRRARSSRRQFLFPRSFGLPSRHVAQYIPQYIRKPLRHDAGDDVLAPVVEVIAVGNDLDVAAPGGVTLVLLRRIALGVFLVTADAEHGTLDLRRERNRVRHSLDAVEKALGADHVPPAGDEHELPPAPAFHQALGV